MLEDIFLRRKATKHAVVVKIFGNFLESLSVVDLDLAPLRVCGDYWDESPLFLVGVDGTAADRNLCKGT